MKKQFVYQFGLRHADDEKKQFSIERDLIFTKEKITQEELNEIAEKHKCDVQCVFLGELVSPKKEVKLEVKYHSEEMIEEKINSWNYEKPQEEVQIND